MKLASIFQNGAILQRDTVIPVWGNSAPGVLVTGTFNGTTVYSRSSATGEFMLYFPPQPAGGPFVLEIFAEDDKIILSDILVGEVWLASGQSNMQYQLNSDHRADKSSCSEPLSRQQEKDFFSSIDDPAQLRYFTVPRIASSCAERATGGVWKHIDPECSAVAAWFALYIQKNLNIPVGIISSNWGGTIAEAWMSSSALASNPLTRELLEKYRASHLRENNYRNSDSNSVSNALAAVLRPDGENLGIKDNFHSAMFDDSSWTPMQVPGSWIRQDIAGNGVVWIRRKIDIPESWVGKKLLFCADSIDKQDITYANGVEIGRTGSGASMTTYNTPRCYTIPAENVSSTELSIAVRGYSACYDGSFNGDWHIENPESGEKIDLSGTWKACCELDLGRVTPKRESVIFGPGNPNTPSILFDSMLRPVIPYAIGGALWYQGESNAVTPQYSREYFEIMKSLIADWRYHWQNPELPFVLVQLAGFGPCKAFSPHASWAYLRESQRKLADNSRKIYMATAIDCGEETDIHPQDKESVGFRLAMCVLNKVFKLHDIVPGGPELLRAAQEAPGTVRLDFARASGLRLMEGEQQSFYISGDGREFYPAEQVTVDGASVVISNANLDTVKCVRYAWADFPINTLYNGDGYPASSFNVELS